VGRKGVFRVRIGKYRVLYAVARYPPRLLVFRIETRERAYGPI
jgi:mRNA-degrading endonuclease RelE of RelBE toxin-antitoxin system